MLFKRLSPARRLRRKRSICSFAFSSTVGMCQARVWVQDRQQ